MTRFPWIQALAVVVNISMTSARLSAASYGQNPYALGGVGTMYQMNQAAGLNTQSLFDMSFLNGYNSSGYPASSGYSSSYGNNAATAAAVLLLLDAYSSSSSSSRGNQSSGSGSGSSSGAGRQNSTTGVSSSSGSQSAPPVLARSYRGTGISAFEQEAVTFNDKPLSVTVARNKILRMNRNPVLEFSGSGTSGTFTYWPAGIGRLVSASLYPLSGNYTVSGNTVRFQAADSIGRGRMKWTGAEISGSFVLPAPGKTATADITLETLTSIGAGVRAKERYAMFRFKLPVTAQ